MGDGRVFCRTLGVVHGLSQRLARGRIAFGIVANSARRQLNRVDLDFRAPHQTRFDWPQRDSSSAPWPIGPKSKMRKSKLTKQTVVAPVLFDLTEILGARFLPQICIGAKRDVLMISATEEFKALVGRGPGQKHFRIHHWHGGDLHEFDLPPTSQIYYFVQALGENYLCVSSRCEPDEHNVRIFDAAGKFIISWHAGDGIEDVQVSPDGQIWVSYFDEGVYGDTPLGNQGLVCFGSQGKLLFEFGKDCPAMPEICDGMSDCYALNVASNRDTWLCYYTNFPLVHLQKLAFKAVFPPPPEMIGSHAFAVCDSRRLFVGGYHFKNRLFWRDEASERQLEIEIVDENGDAIMWKRVHGRGADLFLCDQTRVRRVSLDEIEI